MNNNIIKTYISTILLASSSLLGVPQPNQKNTNQNNPPVILQDYSNKTIQSIACSLGYSKVTQYRFKSHGQLVFKNKQTFITHDIDQHLSPNSHNKVTTQTTTKSFYDNDPFWKKFNNKGKRLGTFNIDLTKQLGK